MTRVATALRAAAVLVAAVATAGTATARADELSDLERRADRLEAQLGPIERAAARHSRWRRCLRELPVAELGDADGGGVGYGYDERDGTRRGTRSALAPVARNRLEFVLLRMARGRACGSLPPRPGGTAESAAAAPAGEDRLAVLERRVVALRRRAAAVERAAARFDAWESCVTQLPVTQYGDPRGAYGFLADGPLRGGPPAYRPAIAIDRSDWDDPDYMLLAFLRGERPGRECDRDPGEAID